MITTHHYLTRWMVNLDYEAVISIERLSFDEPDQWTRGDWQLAL